MLTEAGTSGRFKLVDLSFRLRLTLFFVLIVVLPMVALAVVVAQVASDSADGKTDARLDAGLRAATTLYERAQAESRAAAERAARSLAAQPSAMAALESGGESELSTLAKSLVGGGIDSVELAASGGANATAGPGDSVAKSTVRLVDDSDSEVGTITVSTTTADEYVELVESASGQDAVLIGPDGQIRGSLTIAPEALPDSGETTDFEQDGADFRLAATEPLGSEQLRVGLLAPAGDGGFFASRPIIAIALLAFFVLAARRGHSDPAIASGLRPRDARGRQAHRLRRLLPEGPGRRQRRDGRARAASSTR